MSRFGSRRDRRRLAIGVRAPIALGLACWLGAGCVLIGSKKKDSNDKPSVERRGFELTEEAGGGGERRAADDGESEPRALEHDRHASASMRTSSGSEYWLDRYGDYMSPEERGAFMACPEKERFERFGARLLEFERREALLEPYRDRLDEDEIRAYRHLPDVAAARAWLRKRFEGE